MADTPMALWLLFLGLTFPLIDLATVTMRYTFVLAAARDGVFAGSRENTYTLAKNAVSTAVINTSKSFTGIKNVTTSNVNIVITDKASKTVSRQPSKLTAPATSANIYQIEAVVDADIDPFINMQGVGGILPSVPGITTPAHTTVVCREYFENPQGLNQ